MNMKRATLLAALTLELATGASLASAQADIADGGDGGDLRLTIRLEDGLQPVAEARELEFPSEGNTRSSAAPSSRIQQGQDFLLADFARPNRLEALEIGPEDLPRGRTAVAVRCQAFIDSDGSLEDYFCTSDDNLAYRDLLSEVIFTIPDQTFTPARANGEPVRVLMNFAVYVDCGSGTCVTVAARNHGYHLERLGFDYVAPQPILDDDEWYAGFAYKLSWIRDWMPDVANSGRWDAYKRLGYVIAADVGVEGIAADACLYWVGGYVEKAAAMPVVPPRTRRRLGSAVASLGNVHYVPGSVEGKPVPLRLYEESVTTYEMQREGAVFSVSDILCR